MKIKKPKYNLKDVVVYCCFENLEIMEVKAISIDRALIEYGPQWSYNGVEERYIISKLEDFEKPESQADLDRLFFNKFK